MDDITQRWVPISLDAEQGLLGGIMVNNEAMRFVSDIVTYDDFGEPLHGYIFDCCQKLIAAGKLASPLTLRELIPEQMVAEGMTTRHYLARLCAEATTVLNAADYARIIRDLAKRRQMMLLADRIRAPEPADVLELATNSIEEIDAIVSDLSNQATRGMAASGMMASAMDGAAKAFEANGRIIGIPTGLSKLDRKLLGLTRGELVIMAGRPGMGKSALMVTAARNMAELGYKQMICSQEMSETALGQRMLADKMFNSGAIPYFRFRSGQFSEQDFERMREASLEIANLPIKVEPQPAQTMAQIAAKARQAKRRDGLDVLWVDHLQIMKDSGRFNGRNDQIGEITAGGKAIAKELDCVVVFLCQLSRAVEARENKRPMMSDLRDSGNIEQDADVIIMLFREMYYLQRREPVPGTPDHAVWQTACLRAENKLELLVEKQRAGPTGTVDVFCNIGCNAVRDLDEHEILPTAALPGQVDAEPILL